MTEGKGIARRPTIENMRLLMMQAFAGSLKASRQLDHRSPF
jgi:hypothetical protein